MPSPQTLAAATADSDAADGMPTRGIDRRRWLVQRCGCAGAVLLGGALSGLLTTPARAERITEVLERSHQQRLDTLRTQSVTDARFQRLKGDFDELLVWLGPQLPASAARPELVVVLSPVLAETLLGHVVVAHAGMATAARQERLFFLAHELAHVALGHWPAMQAMYRTHLPGELSPQAAQSAARGIDFDATVLSHQQEFEADRYALKLLRQHGLGLVAATEALLRFPTIGDSPTHPSTRKRLANLHIDSPEAVAELQALQQTGEAVIRRHAPPAAAPD
jgi:Peptidase family M48